MVSWWHGNGRAISIRVTPRATALVLAAVAVFGLGVYLFVEVRAAPASMQAPAEPARPVLHDDAPAPETQEHSPTATTKPGALPGSGTAIRGSEDHEASRPGTPDVALDDPKANPKLDALMDEANKAYDRQEFDDAKAIAGRVLLKQPGNTRMLRVMVSSCCVDGDKDTAQKYFEQLPKFDREQMKQRCDRYGIAFKDPVQ